MLSNWEYRLNRAICVAVSNPLKSEALKLKHALRMIAASFCCKPKVAAEKDLVGVKPHSYLADEASSLLITCI
jgi:hypothetical protein